MTIGYQDTEFKQEIVANLGFRGTQPRTLEVIVDTATRDGGVAGGGASTELAPGVVLGLETANSVYSDFDFDAVDGTELEGNAVILLDKIEDISTGNQRALVAVDGFLNYDRLRWRTAGDKTGFTPDNSQVTFYNFGT